MSIPPAGLSANGLLPIFASKKKWTIQCGKCYFIWQDKVVVSEPSMSICPSCREVNSWSLNNFITAYEKELV